MIKLFIAKIEKDFAKEVIHVSIMRMFTDAEDGQRGEIGSMLKTVTSVGEDLVGDEEKSIFLGPLQEALNQLEVKENCTVNSTPAIIDRESEKGVEMIRFLVVAREKEKPVPSKKKRKT